MRQCPRINLGQNLLSVSLSKVQTCELLLTLCRILYRGFLVRWDDPFAWPKPDRPIHETASGKERVVLLKRHSSIVGRPGRTCKHVRSPNSLPAIG